MASATELTPMALATEPAPMDLATEPAPMASATKSAPMASATEPAPMASATEPAPMASATEPAPMASATEPAPMASATKSAPMASATEPAPMASATEPAPMASATASAPKPAPANRPKVLVEQLRVLLEAIESDPSLYNASNSDMITFLNIEKWLKLADKLNESREGAKTSVQTWKYILRYWSENTKKKMDNGREIRPHPNLSPAEKILMAELEKRLYAFLKLEEAREVTDVTYVGKLDEAPKASDDNSGHEGGVKFVVQLLDVCSSKPDENSSPDRPRKRTIVLKEDDLDLDPTGNTKKFKIVFNQNSDEAGPEHEVILRKQPDTLQGMSRDLEENISTIKSRIHMIHDLWKHRCGDNKKMEEETMV